MNDLFSQDPEFQAELQKRIRQRLLQAMDGGGSATSGGAGGSKDAASIINNIYGGGLMGQLGNGGNGEVDGGASGPFGTAAPDDTDYFVDIMRENMPPDDTGKSPGWTKKVHRFSSRRDPDGQKKKV